MILQAKSNVPAELFELIERDELAPAQFRGSEAEYLRSSGRSEFAQLRQEFESWYRVYPDSEKRRLYADFHSNDNKKHGAAKFELFCHELLLRLRTSVICHPKLQAGTENTPDFFVSGEKGTGFYLEAVVDSGLSDQQKATKGLVDEFRDHLDKIPSPNFFLELSFDMYPRSMPKLTQAKRLISKFLESLDPDEVGDLIERRGNDFAPVLPLLLGNWDIKIRAFPKKPESRDKGPQRTVGVYSPPAELIMDRESLRKALLRKAKKYGVLDCPFVIAVQVKSSMADREILESLFGNEQFTYSVHPDGSLTDPVMTRGGDGVFVKSGMPRYSRVSGVIVFGNLNYIEMRQASVRLYHNLGAARPVVANLLCLPQMVAEQGKFVQVPGMTLAELFPEKSEIRPTF